MEDDYYSKLKQLNTRGNTVVPLALTMLAHNVSTIYGSMLGLY